MPDAERKRKRSMRRRLWLGLVAVLIAGIAIVWIIGLPQKWTAEWALERSTGLIADVEWGSEAPELHIKRLDLYLDRAARRRGEPLLSAFDIRARYSLLASGRKIRSMRIAEVFLDADPSEPKLRDLPLFQRGTATAGPVKPGTSDSTFIPRDVVIERASARLRSGEAYRLLVEPVRIEVDLTEPEAMQIAARSNATVELDYGDDIRMVLRNVTLDAAGTYIDGRLSWSQTTARDGVFRLALEANGPLAGDDAHVDVMVREGEIAGDDVQAFLHSLAAPVRFESFNIAHATARIGIGEPAVSTLAAAARVYALRMPGAEEPMYPGGLAVDLKAEQAETTTAEATLAFARGQQVHATLLGTADAGEIKAAIPGWSHAETVDALPVALRDGVAGVGFDTFTTNATVRWTSETYTIDAHAESKGGGANAEPIVWAVQASGSRESDQAIEGTAEARIGDRRVTASAKYESADHYVAEAVIEEVQIAPWVELVAGEEVAATIGGTIQGTVRAEALGQNAPLLIRPDLILRGFEYETVKLDEITARGAMEYAQTEGRIVITQLRAEAPDGITAIELAGWEYESEADVGGGAVLAGADLDLLGELVGQPDLIGAATLEGTVRIVGDRKELDFTVTSDFLGFGELLMPYGSQMTGEGNIRYNADTDTVTLRGIQAQIGDGTAVRLGESHFTLSPLSGGGTVKVESDLQILVPMERLKMVEAGFVLDASYGFVNEALRADWVARLDAPTLVLPGDGGFAEGVLFSGTGAYENEALTGTGEISATIISAAGGSITNAAGPVLFDGELMRVQQAKGALFRGEVRADIDVGILQDGMPIVLDGTFEGADLAIFTDEVQPPKTELTGTAQGRVTAEYASEMLHSFSFEAVSPGQLSVNRSLVEELLQTDKFLSGIGGNVAKKTMDKLLGTAPQRPFDRGQLSVQLVNDKITGLALLESEKTREYNGLNLRITLDMDQSALAQALTLLQETSTTTMDFSGPSAAQ